MVEIVAEISGNHGGRLQKALTMIEEAAQCGCDHVKFQYYDPLDMPDLLEGDNVEMYNKLHVPPEWLPQMFDCARGAGVGLFASVFSVKKVIDLLQYDVPYVKLASPRSTRLSPDTYKNIIACVPPWVALVVSEGREGNFPAELPPGALRLFCPSGYPPVISNPDLEEFEEGIYWGLSDHTPGIQVPLRFIRAGAEMIEKHFKLEYDNLTYKENCIDSHFSADPFTMRTLCKLAHNR